MPRMDGNVERVCQLKMCACLLSFQVKVLTEKLDDKDRRLLLMAKSQQQQQQQNSSSSHSSLQSAASERSTVRSEPRDDDAMSKLKERFVMREKHRGPLFFFVGGRSRKHKNCIHGVGMDGGFSIYRFIFEWQFCQILNFKHP